MTGALTDDGEQAGLRTLFEEASAGLNPGEREVIELQLRQGLEAGEVATVLGVSRSHAHTLLSRARGQLEASLAVLLVSRAGRDECGELGSMLTSWDGRLTVLLRKRVHRHIEHCPTCRARRAFELRPAVLLDLAPGAALAAGAAESFRLALHAPAGLRAHTIALATGRGPGAVAHSTAVLARAGAFGKHGFPKPAHAGRAGLAGHRPAGHHGVAGIRELRTSSQGQAAIAAAVVIAVAFAAVAFALTGNSGHLTPSADPRQPVAVPATTAATPKLAPVPPAAAAMPVATTPRPTPTAPRAAPTTPSPTATATPTPTPTPTPTTASQTPAPPPGPVPGAPSVFPGSTLHALLGLLVR